MIAKECHVLGIASDPSRSVLLTPSVSDKQFHLARTVVRGISEAGHILVQDGMQDMCEAAA